MAPRRKSYARENRASRSEIDLSRVFATRVKTVYAGVYTKGERRGERCVCKLFKSGSVFSDEYFASEVKIVAKTIDIVDRFNEKNFIDRNVWVNRPGIWTFMSGSSRPGEKNLIEPMIDIFEKFNSNSGWSSAQATA